MAHSAPQTVQGVEPAPPHASFLQSPTSRQRADARGIAIFGIRTNPEQIELR